MIEDSPILKAARQAQLFLESRNLRERLLIIGATVLGVLAIYDVALGRALEQEQLRRGAEINAAQSELARLSQETRFLADEYSVGPNLEYLDDEIRLHKLISALDQRLGKHLSSLIPPTEMADVLERLLTADRDLELLRLESRGAAPIVAGPAAPEEEAGRPRAREGQQLYRHDLVVVMRGGYLPALRYLEAMENLPWQFFWQSFELRVEDYPDAIITIRIYTLSDEENWIGA